MKELITKKFWRDVKNTFDEAREGATPNQGDPQAAPPADAKSKRNQAAAIPPRPEATQPED
jgi:hypothetical protein